jgi:hypothetical protein
LKELGRKTLNRIYGRSSNKSKEEKKGAKFEGEGALSRAARMRPLSCFYLLCAAKSWFKKKTSQEPRGASKLNKLNQKLAHLKPACLWLQAMPMMELVQLRAKFYRPSQRISVWMSRYCPS